MATERVLMDGLITLIDDRDGTHNDYIDLAVEAINQVKDGFPWDGRDGPGLFTHKAKVIFQKDIENPPWAEGKYNGISDGYHMIRIKRVVNNGAPAAGKVKYYTLHELDHAIDQDSLNDANRNAIMALMEPKPNGWGDSKGGDSYWHDPSECWADAFVEAQTDPMLESMYDDDYTRNIADSKYDELYAIVLEGETPGNGDGNANPDPDNPPMPDYTAGIEFALEAIKSAQSELDEARATLEGLLV